MFIIVLFFLIITGFLAVFRFPNFTSRLTSRLRLPRFNFANAFRNPKIKILLNDRHFFNQNIVKISKGPLFIVLGKDADKLYAALEHNEKSNTQIDNSIPWKDRGDSEAFAILTLSNVNYLFVHPTLFEKNFDEKFNSRIRFLIKRLCKLRRQIFIDGIVMTVSVSALSNQTKKSKLSSEIFDEMNYIAHIFKNFSKNFEVKLPLFLIEHDFVNTQEFKQHTYFSSDAVSSKDSHLLGMSCDLTQKPQKQKYEEFISLYFAQFIEEFDSNFTDLMSRSEHFKRGIESVYIMHHVKSVNASIIRGIIYPFLQVIEKEDQYSPASLTILNSVLFSGFDLSENLKNIFDYLSESGTQKSIVPEYVLNKRKKINFALSVTTVCVLSFFVFSIWKSTVFLGEQQKKFENSIENFTKLSDSIDILLAAETDTYYLSELQETSCRIIRNYADLKKISFRSIFLFPSWRSNIEDHLQQKYKEKFSLLFSNFLLQKYLFILNDTLSSKNNSDETTSSESLQSLNQYVEFLSNYKIIYAQLTSNQSDKINQALTAISKIIYSNTCVEDEASFNFLTKIDSKIVNLLKAPEDIKKQASERLDAKSQAYFNSVLSQNLIISSALNLNNDIKDFVHLVDSVEESDENNDDDELFSVRLAFQKTIQDYQLLFAQFQNGEEKSLLSPSDFFGSEFASLIDKIQKSQLFEPAVIVGVRTSAQKTFESFKQQIDFSHLSEEKNQFQILMIDSKSNLIMNPKVVEFFTTFNKLNEIFIATNTNQASKDNDLNSNNTFWQERKLQVSVQKYAEIKTQYNTFEFESYPDSFSEYLQDYIANNLERYWAQSLAAALGAADKSVASNQSDENQDPYGIVSSSAALKQAVQYLVEEHFEDVLGDFDAVFIKQVDSILKQKSILFDKKELFGEKADLKLWDGTTSPAYDIFYASSDETLNSALEKQKQFLIDFYTQYIEKDLKSLIPIMQLRPNLHSFYYNRWYSIYLALEDKNKSYQNFSNFVLSDLKKFRLSDCPNILEFSRDSVLASDYFDSKIEYLYEKLNERCRTIYMDTALDGYEALVNSFNELIAGRYPFVRYQTGVEQTIPNADIQDVEKVLEEFQSFSQAKLSFLLKYNPKFAERADITNFIAQMAKVNSFFGVAPAVKPRDDTRNARDDNRNSRDSTPHTFKLKVDGTFAFRSRKMDEEFANRIVDWELKIGDKTYGSLYGNLQNASFALEYGEPINFTLFFAKDVRGKQASFSDKNILRVLSQNSASYSFKGNWALMRFIDEYKTCSDEKSFCTKEKLRFEIPLENGETIVLFCDVGILDAQGKKVPLPVFPVRAPYLERKIQPSNF